MICARETIFSISSAPCTCFVGSSETSSEPGPDSTVPLPPTGNAYTLSLCSVAPTQFEHKQEYYNHVFCSHKSTMVVCLSRPLLIILGCPVYDPPLRGATTCYLNSTINLMFCSVYCDHNFEFLSTPHNPYFCGPSTNFQWVDATDRLNVFPECTGNPKSQTLGISIH